MKFIYTLRSSNGTYRSEIIKTTWRTSQVQWHLQVHKEPGHRFLLGRSIPQLQTGRSDLDGSEDHWGKTLAEDHYLATPIMTLSSKVQQGALKCAIYTAKWNKSLNLDLSRLINVPRDLLAAPITPVAAEQRNPGSTSRLLQSHWHSGSRSVCPGRHICAQDVDIAGSPQ